MKWNCIFRLLTPYIRYPISMPLFIGDKSWTLGGDVPAQGVQGTGSARSKTSGNGTRVTHRPQKQFLHNHDWVCWNYTSSTSIWSGSLSFLNHRWMEDDIFSNRQCSLLRPLKKARITTAHIWKMPLWVQNPFTRHVRSDPDNSLVRWT